MSYLIDVRNIESLQGIHEAFKSILQHSGFAAKIQEASAQGSHATPDVTPSPAPHREACSPSRSTVSSLVPGHEIEIYQKTLLAIDQIFDRSGLPVHEGNAEEALLTPGDTPSPVPCHDVRQQSYDGQEQSSALDNHPQRLDDTYPSTSLLNTELGIPPRDINPLKRRRADFEDETEDDLRSLFEDDTSEPSQLDDVSTDSSTSSTSSSDSGGAPTETENSEQHDSGSTAQTENSKPNYVDPATQTKQTKTRTTGKNQRKPGPAPTFGEPEFTRLKRDLRILLQPNDAQDFQNTQSILRCLRGRRLQPQKIQPSDSAYVSLRNCLEVYESKVGEASDVKLFYNLMHRVNLVQLAAEDERLAESLSIGGRSGAVDFLVDKLWETDAQALRHDDSKRKKVHNWNRSGRPLLALVREYGYGALIAPGLRLGKKRMSRARTTAFSLDTSGSATHV
ncbi:hypothetical protein BGZ61DRAFT_215778 [Ilyonectria robusta]|uniref:uncharacterized protein n=1 Tax=Ilyonectria robusta TaxID=1079257 RepID=UPI001E8E7CDB|nr:uncharacterized protein BGZ61DRAFT_215778 [Ilyonectria robusta]KAH8652961.1 hypothetical protein BGZ61DRAFT_215778 [Ilyonectria robusta]